MNGHRRKELNLPPNFGKCWFNLRDSFLSQRPCNNPPHHRDLMDDDDHAFVSQDMHDFNEEIDRDDDFMPDPILTHGPESLRAAGPSTTPSSRVAKHAYGSQEPESKKKQKATPSPPPIPRDFREKNLHEFTKDSISSEVRPKNTAAKRRQTPAQAKLANLAEKGTKKITDSIDKIREIEEKRTDAQYKISEKQIQYFRSRDTDVMETQRGLVRAIETLSKIMGDARARNNPPPATPEVPPAWVEEGEATEGMCIWPRRPPTPAAHSDNDDDMMDDFEINLGSPMVTPDCNYNHITDIDGEELTDMDRNEQTPRQNEEDKDTRCTPPELYDDDDEGDDYVHGNGTTGLSSVISETLP
jgi:hypothetical protein